MTDEHLPEVTDEDVESIDRAISNHIDWGGFFDHPIVIRAVLQHYRMADMREALDRIDHLFSCMFWTSDDGEAQRLGGPSDAPTDVAEVWREVQRLLGKGTDDE